MLKKATGFILLLLLVYTCSSCSAKEDSEIATLATSEESSLERESTSSSTNIESSKESSTPSESSSPTYSTINVSNKSYDLVWNDEFKYTGALDSTKWGYDLGSENGGWGNNEKQYYTNSLSNVKADGDNLVITAKKEKYGSFNYTSARVVTKNKADFTYGYFEVKAKLPSGIGTWPALWLLPTDNVYGGWPNSGEIDMMEMVGTRPNHVLGSIHTRNYNWYNGISVSKGESIDVDDTINDYNLYAVEWTEDYINFFVNNELYFTFNNEGDGDYKKWPFDQDFHLIFNIAMGGTLGGTISNLFTETSMTIDYVRVYQ